MAQVFKPTKVQDKPEAWLVRGADGQTVHPCCAAHKDPHPSCGDANLCLYEHEMDNSQAREQAPMVDVSGVAMKSFSKCQFPGCGANTDQALFNAIVPHGKHFCAKHLKPKYLSMVVPYVLNDNPDNSYHVTA